jgi:hypothetical protein
MCILYENRNNVHDVTKCNRVTMISTKSEEGERRTHRGKDRENNDVPNTMACCEHQQPLFCQRPVYMVGCPRSIIGLLMIIRQDKMQNHIEFNPTT